MKKQKRKTKVRGNQVPVAKKKFSDAFEQWKDGTPMSQLAKSLGARRRELKKAFVKLAGSKDKFTALRDAGAGGKAFGGKRASGRTKQVIAADDSKVPVLHSKDIPLRVHSDVLKFSQKMRETLDEELQDARMPEHERSRKYTGYRNAKRILKREHGFAKYKGWRCEHYQSRYGTQIRLLAPDGKTYVRATPAERADFIVLTGMQRSRFKHEKEARSAKTDQKENKLVERGIKAQKHRKKIRKQKRTAKSRAA